VDVAAFGEQLRVDGTRWTEVFTPAERELRAPGRDEDEHLSARWAAKEAFVKAWSAARAGRAPQLDHLDHREIEVIRDAWGRPILRLHGAVEHAVTTGLGECTTHLSLSHDGGSAVAFVVIER
jgi:holo-[acyl-carrier protein] synthase